MAKTRLSISIDEGLAAAIRKHAEQSGVDVSTYLADAASRHIAEAEQDAKRFAQIDATIEAAESAATIMPALPDVALTDEERREVRNVMELVYDMADEQAA